MKRILRAQRDRQILTYLATPARYSDSGEPMRNSNGNLVYPSLHDAAEKFQMSPEHISRLKSKYGPEYDKIKQDISEGVV